LCRSTRFGRFHAHHQELTTALTAFGFTFERGGSSVVSRGLAVLMMGMEAPETCCAKQNFK
jgi:hypothetical protein